MESRAEAGPRPVPMVPSSQDEAGRDGAHVPAPTHEAPPALRLPGGRGGGGEGSEGRGRPTHGPGPGRRGEAAGFPQDAPWREHMESGFSQASISTQEVPSEGSGMTNPSDVTPSDQVPSREVFRKWTGP